MICGFGSYPPSPPPVSRRKLPLFSYVPPVEFTDGRGGGAKSYDGEIGPL